MKKDMVTEKLHCFNGLDENLHGLDGKLHSLKTNSKV